MFSKMVSKQVKTSGLKLSVIAVEKKSELKDVFATVFVNRILTKPRQRFGDSKRHLRSSQKKRKANNLHRKKSQLEKNYLGKNILYMSMSANFIERRVVSSMTSIPH